MVKEIDINKIYFRLFDENGVIHPTRIENSPVYKVVCGNEEPYTEYYKRMVKLGKAKSWYMDTEKFLEFEKTFNYLEPPYENEYIRLKKTGHLYAGWDGAHRISIEKKRGKKTIKVLLMDGEFKHQGYSNIIDVTKIFNNLKYSDYVIIKDDGNFPNYFDGDDLDIFCKNKDELHSEIMDLIEEYQDKYKITEHNKGVRIHVDFRYKENEKINYRIDMLDTFPYLVNLGHTHNKIEVRDEYYDIIFSRKIKKTLSNPLMVDEGNITVNFPCETDDLVLRFIEWTWQPHKTRHINYVIKNLKNKNDFIKTVNKYTNIEIDNQYVEELLKNGK